MTVSNQTRCHLTVLPVVCPYQKTFLPLGSDKESNSDFQLIAGTNRDLMAAVRVDRFREDLLARINLWTFTLPGLRSRPEDLEPNLDFELDRYAEKIGQRVTINEEAHDAILRFALSAEAKWLANFRDLNAAVVRMATLAQGGRISAEIVTEEIVRMKSLWESLSSAEPRDDLAQLLSANDLGKTTNDSDRLRKYLQRFHLDWDQLPS